MSRSSSFRVACAAGLALGGLVVATPVAGAAAAPAVAPEVDVRSCARPALSPSLDVRAPATGKRAARAELTGKARREARLAHAVAAHGRELKVPARAQALAVSAALAGDLADGRPVTRFYRELAELDAWETLPPSIAVHRVLGTPDPFAYEATWTRAVSLLSTLATTRAPAVDSLVSAGGRAPSRCYVAASDASALPLPPGSSYTVRTVEPGRPEKSQKSTQPTGDTSATPPAAGRTEDAGATERPETRFEAACGTPVVAATAGTVEIVTDDTESGPWMIKVRQEGKQVTSSYSHVQRPTVRDGDTVLVGQQLAEVGDLGEVNRCALGLSMTVREKGGTRALDPIEWLTANGAAVGEQPTRIAETSFRIASYNVLGHHLTAPGGGRPGWGSGTSRVAAGIGRLEAQDASIVVLNEFESPQAGVFLADGDWSLHRATFNNTFRDGNGNGNAVAWRTDTWKLVEATEFTVPWQVTLHMPVVRLENLDTKAQVIVIGVHNPASTSVKGNQSGARAAARQIELSYITQLRSEMPDVPVIIAGDMNERAEAFCGFTGTGILQSSAGGSVGGACSVPRHGPVDWIFGTLELDFTGQYIDRGTLGRISDHPIVLGNVVYPEHDVPRVLVERGDPALSD